MINNICPKCGGFAKKSYDNARDIIWMTCEDCGYNWDKDPLDKVKMKEKIEESL